MTNPLRDSFGNLNKKTIFGEREYSGLLGILIGGERTVDIANRKGYVYVRIHGNMSEVVQAWNDIVSPVYDLPVIVVRNGNNWKIKSRDSDKYGNNWISKSPFLPQHGNSHSFAPEYGGGGDIVWVDSRQVLPLLGFPSGSYGASSVLINPINFRYADGSFGYIGNTGTPALDLYKPTGVYANMVLVYADGDTGSIGFLVNSGTYFDASITGTSSVLPYLPTLTSVSQIPIVGIRLVSGTNAIGWSNLYDLRQFFQVPSSIANTGIGGIVIQNEGTDVSTGTIINFTNGANATVSGTVINVDVPFEIPEGKYLQIGSDEVYPTSSWIGFGDQNKYTLSGTYVKLVEFYDDCFGVTIDDVPLMLIGRNEEWDISVRLGDIFNSGFIDGNTWSLSLSGSYFNHNVYAPNLTGTTITLANSGSVNIYKDGLFIVSGTDIDFVGQNVWVNNSGTRAEVIISGSVGGVTTNNYYSIPNTITIQDDGLYLVSGTTLNFSGQNVWANASGSVVTISVSGTSTSGITDAPIDGNIYGRQNAAWVEVTQGTQYTCCEVIIDDGGNFIFDDELDVIYEA